MFQNIKAVLEEMKILSRDCHPELPRGKEFHQLGFGVGAITYEEAVALYGLIFVTRPHVIIELGTETGASSLVLGAAAKDLGIGIVYSIDRAKNPPTKAQGIVEKYRLPVTYVCEQTSLEFLDSFTPDPTLQHFFFSDTDIPVRPLEVDAIQKFYPKGTVVAVHDTADLHPYGPMKLPQKINAPCVELPSPRGLTILRT